MVIQRTSFIQNEYAKTSEWKQITQYSDELYAYLSTPKVLHDLEIANVPRANSKEIQDILLQRAKQLGFKDESQGLFQNYDRQLRPDFYLPIQETGIIIEVERGKTNQNNMDFLDFWKCHICESAHYLFLFVPNVLIQNNSGRIAGRPYEKVIKNFAPFFEINNYTNVRGVVIFGY